MPFEIVYKDDFMPDIDAVIYLAKPYSFFWHGRIELRNLASETNLTRSEKAKKWIRFGEAIITSSYHQNNQYEIYAAIPYWRGSRDKTVILQGYQESLRLAVAHGCKSIIIPLLSTEVHRVPDDIALEIALTAIRQFLTEHEMQIYLSISDSRTYSRLEALRNAIQEQISETRLYGWRFPADYANVFKSPSISSPRTAARMPANLELHEFEDEEDSFSFTGRLSKSELEQIHRQLEKREETFSQSLFRMIDQRGLKDSEIYRKANIDRKLFSKIRSNVQYKPRKTTALALAIALELNLDETKDFIGKAGHALSRSSDFDIIVEYFIVHRIYDVMTLNLILYQHDQPLIGM